MKNQDWFSTFTERKGKEISRILFKSFNYQEAVTKEFNVNAWQRNKKKNPKKPYVLPIVNHYFQFWKEEGFIEKSKPLREWGLLTKEAKKRLRYLPKDYSLSILNFEPIYKYCEKKKISFTEEEKSFLNDLLLSEKLRESILKEFPEEDIINATLKFYVKNFLLRYFYLLKEIREDRLYNKGKKYKEAREKAEEINNPKTKMQKEINKVLEKVLRNIAIKHNLLKDKRKITDFDTLKVVTFNHKNLNNPGDIAFRFGYLSQISENKELVQSVDKKILSALNLSLESCL